MPLSNMKNTIVHLNPKYNVIEITNVTSKFPKKYKD